MSSRLSFSSTPSAQTPIIPTLSSLLLRPVSNPLPGTRSLHTTRRVRRHEFTSLNASPHVIRIPCLSQSPPVAAEHHSAAGHLGQRVLDLRACIAPRRTRHDARRFQRLVGVEALEELHGAREEVDELHSGRVGVAVAGRRERVDAGAVFVPLVLPEVLGAAPVRQPVLVHIVQQLRLLGLPQNLGDVAVMRCSIAELLIRPVASIWPKVKRLASAYSSKLPGLLTISRAASNYYSAQYSAAYPRTASAEAGHRGI